MKSREGAGSTAVTGHRASAPQSDKSASQRLRRTAISSGWLLGSGLVLASLGALSAVLGGSGHGWTVGGAALVFWGVVVAGAGRHRVVPQPPGASQVPSGGLGEAFDSVAGALLVADAGGRVVRMNGTAARLTGVGLEEAVGRPVESVLTLLEPGGVRRLLDRAVESQAFVPFSADSVLASGDGEARPLDGGVVAHDGAVKFVFRDVGGDRRAETDRVSLVSLVAQARTEVAARRTVEATLRETEEQLRHAQKMEAVGRLAGGAAHDFNNALSVILSYAELIMSGLGPDDPIREDLTAIRHAGKRAAELTRQLLLFSRHEMLEPQVLDVNESLVATENMLRRLMGEDVELVSLPGALDATVRVDPGSLEQMIMNLAVNARDAMPDGGTLTIATSEATLDDAYAAEHLGVKPGNYVELRVTDTGTGMDLATQARMFEPFFTTKERGKGTGLGLSTVFGIVKQSGGHIRVETEPGSGSAFHIYLPRVEERAEEGVQKLAPRRLSGSETILLVEDEELVRSAARTILLRQGYGVLDAASASEALAVAKAHAGNIDLLLSDVVMPQMAGPELAALLCRARPEVRVLFMSGYADDSRLHQRVLDSGALLLQKPFTFESLSRRVREVLDAPVERAG